MPRTAANDRVTARPDPSQWRDDEIMTLREAAALFWPDGPFSERTLRTAVRDGRLPISQVARKFFVTKASLRVLSVCEPLRPARLGADALRGGGGLENDLAAIRRMREC